MEIPWERGKKPTTEVQFFSAICIHVVGADIATQDYIKAKFAIRMKAVSSDPETIDLTEEINGITDEYIDDEVDDDDIQLQHEKIREEARKRRNKIEKKMTEFRTEGFEEFVGAAAAEDAPSPSAPTRVFRPVEGNGYSSGQARCWIPPFTKLSKDDKRENRWRVDSRVMNGEKSKAFGPRSSTSDYEAMVFCIQLAWRAYTKAEGHPCPYVFDE